MTEVGDNKYQAIVVGAGHAGAEAAYALARTGIRTLMLTMNLDSIAYLACNPSIGGTAKGHLVREIDALGGIMAIAADKTLIQLKMLNESKGPAVQSLRAQVDKYDYHYRMKNILENTPNLSIKQTEVTAVITDGGRAAGVKTARGEFFAERVILACGVYLGSQIITGEYVKPCGPNGFERAVFLTRSLAEIGFEIRRFKTGTPARIDGKTVDYSKLEEQRGNPDTIPFSHITDKKDITPCKTVCYLGYTTEKTKEIIHANLSRAPMYSGQIKGTGARYCPSIEDKVVRFADKDRHQFFLEPEGLNTNETYVQGISTSMPYDVQSEIIRSLDGMENAEIMRNAYAIEYDCINPQQLNATLEYKNIKGLYCAGQINGTSGYEEAAAQGLIAGINASLSLRGEPPLVLRRSDGYIGVLIDDLITKGTNEPYRMMTSRAEHRLHLRQDNADTRLTPAGRAAGLVDDYRYSIFMRKQEDMQSLKGLLDTGYSPAKVKDMFEESGEIPPKSGVSLADIMRRNIPVKTLIKRLEILHGLREDAVTEVCTELRYEGYLARQQSAIEGAARLEEKLLPDGIEYSGIKGLRLEARQKLNAVRPRTLGQASRISGVSPADINVLILYLAKDKHNG